MAHTHIDKLPTVMTDEYRDGLVAGMNNMRAMALLVCEEHPNYTAQQIAQYIKENL